MKLTYTGIIVGYRRGTNTQYPSQVYITISGVDRKTIHSFIGSKVIARDSKGNVYIGRVVKVLGSRNPKAVVVFRRNIPGQLIGKPVLIEKSVEVRESGQAEG